MASIDIRDLDRAIAVSEAKVETRIVALSGRLDASAEALKSYDGRLGDLSARMASVPADLAALKATVAELPRKGFIVVAAMGSLTAVAAISAFVQWVLSAHLLTGGH